MKGDFTRTTFDRDKHYSSVRQQQGRVQLDSEWNEELDILNHIERTARVDVIGHCGGPIHNAGFEIGAAGGQLNISPGRYYVEGILCEKEAEESVTGQADLPGYQPPAGAGSFLAYLDVWERHVTALEEPAIREVALGGPDTATRTQVVPQVKLLEIGNEGCDDFAHPWAPPVALSDGRLAARSQPADPPAEPCIVPASAGYRRLENQLYRVEIHTAGGLGAATFKWSRENGSVVFRVLGQDGPDQLLLSSPPLDANLGLASGNWVELTDDGRDLRGEPGALMQVTLVEGTLVTIDPTSIDDPMGVLAGSIDLATFGPNTRLRRWESAGALTVEVPGANSGFIPLEEGVEIAFAPASTAFQVGDYWQIPARSALGDVLWPEDPANPGQPELQGRHGILHYYCPLAIIDFDGEEWGQPQDCRDLFPPLTELPEGEGGVEGSCCCCGVTVGDGELSQGDFNDLHLAVAFLTESGGGHICLLPGIFNLDRPVLIDGLEVTVMGCGFRSVVRNNGQEPAFQINNANVRFEKFAIDATTAAPAAVVSNSGLPVIISRCFISNHTATSGLAAGPAIYAGASHDLAVRLCALVGGPAIVAQVTSFACHDNGMNGGGIWLEEGSEDVEIAGNTIGGGPFQQGVTLGGLTLSQGSEAPGLRRVVLRDNHIGNTGLSAIGSVSLRQGLEAVGQISDLTIAHNRLENCAFREEPDPTFDGQAMGGIVLNGLTRGRIHGNRIAGHGLGSAPAVGILLSLPLGVEIQANHIEANGLQAEPGGVVEGPLLQGGIIALQALGGALDLADGLLRPGQPALQVHDNVVVSPAGQCLVAYGYGPISIRDNALTSRAIYIQPPLAGDPTGDFGKFLFEATCVSVFNLGHTARRDTRSLPLGAGVTLERDALLGDLGNLILPSEESGPTPAGQLAYHGNQSDQQGRPFAGDFGNPAVALISFGDAAAQDNQHVSHLVEGKQLADWHVLASTARVQDNWVDEEDERANFSIVAFGERYCQVSHNQAAHCIFAAGGNVIESNNQAPDPDTCRQLVEIFGGLLPG
ncbi:MAG: DUF6519 domain-containing protein [Candidatus Promineifilaceae bacterium]